MQQTPRKIIFWHSAEISMLLNGPRLKIHEKSKYHSLWHETRKCHFYRRPIFINQNYRFWSELYELCDWIYIRVKSILPSTWDCSRSAIRPSRGHVESRVHCLWTYNGVSALPSAWWKRIIRIHDSNHWSHTKTDAGILQKI